MAVSYASVAPQLHERYHNKAVQIFVETQNPKLSPFVAMLEIKPGADMEDSFGKGYVIPVTTSRGGAVSNTFATSRAKSLGSTGGAQAANDKWLVTSSTKHATAHWERESILAASKSEEKLYDVMKNEIDARLGKLKHRLAIDLFEEGYGRAATITANPTASPNTITVSASTINRFEIGDDIEVSATVSGALRAGGSLNITGIDPDTYKLTLSGSPVALSWANGDTVFFAGDHTDSTLTAPVGLRGYIPDTAPTSTLYGIVRSGIPATSGLRINCASYDVLTSLFKGAERLTLSGSVPAQAFISVSDFMSMSMDKDRVKIMDFEVGKFNIGFTGAKLLAPGGSVDLMPEMLMEQGRYYMGDYKSDHAPFVIHTDDLINVDDFTGRELKDVDGATTYEMRWYARLAVAFPGPGKFLVGYGIPA